MSPHREPAEIQVALMRGINVGGKNKLPMRDLAALFTEAGCAAVTTYIQSGNVVCRASRALARELPAVIEGAIHQRFGLKVPLVLRSAAELAEIVRGNPFPGAAADTLHVAFLAAAPNPSQVAGLDPQRSPPDEFAVQGREIYLCFKNGVARSKLTNAYFDTKLATTTTVRNWRTVLKLLDMSAR
jgi:uncharacterized protein (DUF1697 family)